MRRRFVALTVLPLLLFGAACGEATKSESTPEVDMGDPIKDVEVSGDFGKVPEVSIEAPLKLEKTQSHVVTAGEGNAVVADKQALLHLYVANGTSGKKAATTYDQGQPVPLQMSEDQLFPAVLDAVIGKPAGSRVTVAAKPADAYGDAGAEQLGLTGKDNVVFVVDIMSAPPTDVLDGPEGEKAAPPAGAPAVEEKNGVVSGLQFSDAAQKPSGELQVIPLIEGDGEPVRKGTLATFDYLGQIYGTDKVFDESFSKKPVTFPIGVGGLIKGWDEGLVGVNEGSRVLIIAPPEYGYGEAGNPQAGIKGTDTLAFVVDILGVDPGS